MRISKFFEKFRGSQLQVIELWAEANSREEAANLGYDDFKADLTIDHRFVADISHVLSDAGVFTEMVDAVDWEEVYCESVNDAAGEPVMEQSIMAEMAEMRQLIHELPVKITSYVS